MVKRSRPPQGPASYFLDSVLFDASAFVAASPGSLDDAEQLLSSLYVLQMVVTAARSTSSRAGGDAGEKDPAMARDGTDGLEANRRSALGRSSPDDRGTDVEIAALVAKRTVV